MRKLNTDSPGPFPGSASRFIRNLHLIPLCFKVKNNSPSDTLFTPTTRKREMAFLWYIDAIVLVSKTRRALIDS